MSKPRCPKCATKLKKGVCPEKRPELGSIGMYPPAQLHSSTSVAAAHAIKPHVPTMREKVLDELRRWPGTDQEIAKRLGMAENSVRPRRIELERDRQVEHLSFATTSAGRRAKVYGVVGVNYGEFHGLG